MPPEQVLNPYDKNQSGPKSSGYFHSDSNKPGKLSLFL